MPEDYEEGIGLLKPNNNMPTSFVPDYSFSSNANLLNVTEATEMLEHTPQTTKETKETINKRPFRWKQWFTKNTVPEGTPRRIYVNKPEMNEQQHFMTNAVSTAKYNLFTFLPKFLYEEFSKSANIFFLFISGIQVLTLFKKKNLFWETQWLTCIIIIIIIIANSQYFTYIKIHYTRPTCHCLVDHSG